MPQLFAPTVDSISPQAAAWGSLLLLLGSGVALLVLLCGKRLRRTKRHLAASEDQFRLLFERGGVGMALLSPDGDFLQVNPALLQMLGYSASELVGRHLLDVMHE